MVPTGPKRGHTVLEFPGLDEVSGGQPLSDKLHNLFEMECALERCAPSMIGPAESLVSSEGV